MNYLLIDAGNSFCKVALFDIEDNLVRERIFSYSDFKHNFIQFISDYLINSIYLSNVKGKDFFNLLSSVSKTLLNAEIILIETSNYPYINSRYENIERLGVDRWLAILALHLKDLHNFIVIDCGTAITIDLVTNDVHHGGLISPGFYTALNSLDIKTDISSTDNEKTLNFKQHQNLSTKYIATNTQDAIKFGIILNICSYVDTIIYQYHQDYISKKVTSIPVYITGGDAQLLSTHLKSNSILENNLVIQGMQKLKQNPL